MREILKLAPYFRFVLVDGKDSPQKCGRLVLYKNGRYRVTKSKIVDINIFNESCW
jgi:hypothetical protein